MMFRVLLAWAVVGLAAGASLPSANCKEAKDLEILSFNIQIFGEKKSGKADVMEKLDEIIEPFHLVLVQEVRQSDSSVAKAGSAVVKLLGELNEKATDCPSKYANKCWQYVMGERQGRSNSKEQYAYLYRSDRVEITGHFDFPKTADFFQRPPFVIKFHDRCSKKLEETAIVSLHSEPKGAFKELQHLNDVYAATLKHDGFTDIKNVILMGDFNMDCSYVSNKKEAEIFFAKDSHWKLLIGDDADTTVAKSSCAYDRFAVTGDNLKGLVEKVFLLRFDKDASGAVVMENKVAKRVSDHYPVILRLNTV